MHSENFLEASAAFVDVVRDIPPTDWERPGLGTWSLRSLVGHTSRALATVEEYLALDEPESATLGRAEEYFSTFITGATDPGQVARRGVEAGERLGPDPLAVILPARERTLALLAAQRPGRVIQVRGAALPLEEYLRTRVFELVVHTLDIGHAIGRESHIPQAPLADAVLLAAAIAGATGSGTTLLEALTGRGSLPPGFSVV
ncbi:maleylpyruvate isomerase N-terminal domain-containing protein [Arthrobacter sp. Br18]|uniref:maleylpyruvate isomerase N-terminal domain-containing protein n=1 Tax=Arthrobacter sp. Br18 TaxID=1312954 RepID=UPI00047E4C9F|nr:maleylpyruvate isomerase N-terminal domain-containing protein [Arthrobacter sp. Br18]